MSTLLRANQIKIKKIEEKIEKWYDLLSDLETKYEMYEEHGNTKKCDTLAGVIANLNKRIENSEIKYESLVEECKTIAREIRAC